MRHRRLIVWAVLMACCSLTARAQWTQTAGPEGAMATAIVADGQTLVAVVNNEIYHLVEGTWREVGSLREFDGGYAALGGKILLRDRGWLFANTRQGVKRSSDLGISWESTGMEGTLVRLGGHAAIVSEQTIYRSEDGTNWKASATLPPLSSLPVELDGALYFTEGYETGLRRTTDNGITWEIVPTGEAIIGPGSILAEGREEIYAAAGRMIYRSTDGVEWTDIGHDLPEWLVIDDLIPGGELMITTNMGFHRLVGNSWKKIPMAATMSIDPVDDGAFLATRAGIFRLEYESERVTSLNRGLIAGNAGMLGAIGETVLANTSNGLYRSTDRGENWAQVSDFMGWGFARNGGTLYTIAGLAYRSTDSGATWTPTGPLYDFEWEGPPQRVDVTSIAAADGAVYLGVGTYLTDKGANGGWASGGIFRSTDDGETWREMNSGIAHGAGYVPAPITSIVATDDQVVISTAAGIYRSTDRGARWIASNAGLPAHDQYTPTGELTLVGSTIYLRILTGYYESTDGGLSWRPMSSPLPEGFDWYSTISVVDNTLYMRGYRPDGNGGFDDRLFVLRDAGWEDITATQPDDVIIESIIRAGQYLYAGTRHDGVWVQQSGGALPSSVRLFDVGATGRLAILPNPAIGESEIRYTLSERGRLRVAIISMLGEEVAAFDRGMSEAGEHALRIDTRTLPAGVYIVRATAGTQVHEGRLVVGR